MTDNISRDVKDVKNHFILEEMKAYRQSNLDASDISGWFGDSFQSWTVDDFNTCMYNNLTQLRKILREKGVYVDTGRTKPEVIKALMAAVKNELPWPDQTQNPSLKAAGKRPAENTIPLPPRKALNFQPRLKTENSKIEPSYPYQQLKFHPQSEQTTLDSQSSRTSIFNLPESSSKLYSTGNTPEPMIQRQYSSYDKELGVFLRLYVNDDLKYSGQPNDTIKFKYKIFLDNCARASLPKVAYRIAIPTMFIGSALKRYFATCQNMLTHEEVFSSLRCHNSQ